MMDAFYSNLEIESDEELISMMNAVSNGIRGYVAGNHILTDDKAPVEVLGMKVIDELIKGEVTYYKKVYKEQGLQGLINSL